MPDARNPSQRKSGGIRGARDRFTNRHEETRRFLDLLNAPSGSPLPLLMFYGVGGAGKSSLFDYLQQQCDEYRVPWAVANLEEVREPAEALPRLYRHLKETHQLRFARFERTLLIYSFRQGLTPPQPGQGGELVGRGADLMLDVLGLVPGIGEVMSAVKLGKSALKTALMAREELRPLGGDAIEYERLIHLELGEFWSEFVDAFAEDLIATVPQRQGPGGRCALFFDTHEVLWRDARGGASSQDTWIRRLCEDLHGQGVLMVVTGRDRLDWGDGWDEADAHGRRLWLEQHRVGGLSRGDALGFLRLADVNDAPTEQAILELTNEADADQPSAHHCYLLALCAEIVANTRTTTGQAPDSSVFGAIPSGDQAAKPLTERFLSSLPNQAMVGWLEELSLTPRFDEDFALALDAERRHLNGRAGWQRLLELSLIEPATGGFVEMHKLFREGLKARLRPEAQRAVHAFAFAHWSARADESDWVLRGLAWYHHRFVERPAAMRAYEVVVKEARQRAKPQVLEALFGWWSDVNPSVRSGTWEEASDLNWFGRLLRDSSLGRRTERLLLAIECYENALRVRTELAYPADWASTQNDLGNAHMDLPTGDRAINLENAVACYERALRVRTESDYPEAWARTQNNLGNAYAELPSGERSSNLEKAIECYENALRVRTEAGHPILWAVTQNNLGNAYRALPTGDRPGNLGHAIACYENALKILTESEYPTNWARNQNSLGNVYVDLPSGNRSENFERATVCYENALRVRTESEYPADWAETQRDFGLVWHLRGDRDRALTAFHNAERAYRSVGMSDKAIQVAADIEKYFGSTPI